ncbi:hypothetical protein BGZ76_007235, partial [Entomortierella beljakovae]
LQRRREKGLLPSEYNITIRDDISAVENFVHLNRIDGNKRKHVPLTPMQQPLMSFNEGNLLCIFWQNETLREVMRDWNLEAKTAPVPYVPSQSDMHNWIMSQEPGTLVTKLLSPIGRPIEKREGPRGYKDSTILMSFKQMEKHIKCIRGKDFNHRAHSKRGYALTGTIRTDGFRLQLLAFKLRELLSVRYNRLPEEKRFPRITSTVGGVDYYLTEVRNIIKTQQDVKAIWGCQPEKIKILGIDLGQACVVGASALLPKCSPPKIEASNNKPESSSGTDAAPSSDPTVFHNLAVKQKAVYQPMFKLRR